uniref:LNS2/PITP domain-containing protein n=1 Tax=Davidia involucrata TaxID=16924 RepID=A0A5B7ACR6_DAVIN
MYAVGRIGSYITRGVYTVSAPFHPFGGAVDIIVVEQEDGSFKSSPWYVRFGKFQGVLKTKEKVVNISVDGVEANFHMYLDHKGEAYFLREVDGEEVESAFYPSSSSEEMDGQSHNRKPMKSTSCNYDANQSNSFTHVDLSNGKIVARTSSRRSQILGLVFGRRSMKEDRLQNEVDDTGVVRANSLERAEIAADLLEVKWSTNLASGRHRKDNASRFSAPDTLNGEADKDLWIHGQKQVDSLADENSLDYPMSHEETGFHENEMGNSSPFGFQKPESSVEEAGVEMSCLITKHVIGTLTSSERGLEESDELNSRISRKIEELGARDNADHSEIANGVNSEITVPNSQIQDSSELEPCPSKKLNEEPVFDGVSEEEIGADGLQSLVYCETSKTSGVGLDDSGEQAEETLYLSCGKCGEVCVHAETFHETTELISKVNSLPETGLLVAKEPLNIQEFMGERNCCDFLNDAKILESEGNSSSSIANSIVTETYTQVVTIDSLNGSVKEVESQNICTISGFNNSICQAQDEENVKDEDNTSEFRNSSECVSDPQDFNGGCVPIEAINTSPSDGSDEEQFLFGDLDDFRPSNIKCMESISSGHEEKENHSSLTPKSIEAEIESLDSDYESYSSPEKFIEGNSPNDIEDPRQKSGILSSHINIPRSSKVARKEVGRMVESLPNMWSHVDDVDAHVYHHSLGCSRDLNSKSSKWMLLRKDVSSFTKSDVDKEHQLSQAQPATNDAQIFEELTKVPANPVVGDLSKAIDASSGSWRLWPFPFRRSRSMKATQPAFDCTRSFDAENALESTAGKDGEKNVLKRKVLKKKVRAITPTSEQLASLNLKEGRNTVTFTFSTPMLGKQQVDARIYLWKWDTRIVISDVDGTITKSDVLGQFMPLVGKDWSQTGVAHLFSAIKENGYQLLFLSARAISQAYHTRQFLFNLKQDGKALPDGPVVISPDGLFPSLFREVIRRAPHEFKIACLEDIKALFPADCNPFYAGFGNRDTDEISYLKVGIPKGKIFIINPKGEVAVNRRIDTKSYTSLHALVHGMFPPMSSSEQEDFNSWNYWKLPPPAIDV